MKIAQKVTGIAQQIIQIVRPKQTNSFRWLEQHENRKKATRIAQNVPGVAQRVIGTAQKSFKEYVLSEKTPSEGG